MQPRKYLKIYFLLLTLLICFFSGSSVYASESTTDELKPVDISELQDYWDLISKEYQGFLPESQRGSLSDFVFGDKSFSLKDWGIGLIQFSISELLANGKLLGMLILLTVFSVFLNTLQSSFEKSAVSKVANVVVMFVLLLFAVSSFQTVMSYVTETVESMIDFMMAMIPILLAMTATSGGVTSAAFFHPVLLFLMNSSVLLVQYVVLPLLFFATILAIVDQISEQLKVTNIANMLRSVSIWLLGILMTVFLAVLSIQGTVTAVTDGVGMRTMKFVSGNFIPVIGKMMTDATDTVINTSVLLKNTIGIAGLGILLLTIIFPALKILMMAFMYKFASLVLEPIGGGIAVKCIEVIGKNILYAFAAFMMVGLMYFLSIAIVILAGNITMMVR